MEFVEFSRVELPLDERRLHSLSLDYLLVESDRCLHCCLTCYDPDSSDEEQSAIGDLRREEEMA